MPSNKKLLQAAAGSAGGDPLYVEDVFSTYIYDGNNTTNAIVNGLDLAGKGGMLWTKRRDGAKDNRIWDTERGRAVALISNTTAANGATSTASEDLISFNSNGFTFGANAHYGQNSTSQNFVSWSFRKAKKFFDVVTYTGDDTSNQTIAHNLGSVPGFILLKRTSTTGIWGAAASDNSGNYKAGWRLDSTSASALTVAKSNVATDSVVNVGYWSGNLNGSMNTSGVTYVAYVFASDAGGFGEDEDENIIKCGSYTTDGSGNATVNLGFEPQWILSKRTNATGAWYIRDVMRGMPVDGNNALLYPNSSGAEAASSFALRPSATGFTAFNDAASQTNVYIAIRRPMKTPEAGTEVFTAVSQNTNTSAVTSGFPVDMVIMGDQPTNWGYNWSVSDRLRGGKNVSFTSSTAAENTGSNTTLDSNTGLTNGWVSGGTTGLFQMFKRATGFMDVLCYTGDGGRRTPALTHNLGVVPELVIVKSRSSTGNWFTLSTSLGQFGFLNNGDGLSTTDIQYAFGDGTNYVAPTSTALQVDSSINGNTQTFVAYLFATVAGVSKVGTYTGTGTTHNIDCGFTGGARFVMIKRADGSTNTGDWYVWDSVRGIVAGNDPYLLLNSTAAEVTNTDYIDPLNAGFTITSGAPAALNYNNGTFIFLAIA